MACFESTNESNTDANKNNQHRKKKKDLKSHI